MTTEEQLLMMSNAITSMAKAITDLTIEMRDTAGRQNQVGQYKGMPMPLGPVPELVQQGQKLT
jgi:hypothetical protein